MSKYDSLWEYIGKCGEREITLTYDDIEKICGVPIDHSFSDIQKGTERLWVCRKENIYEG